MDFLSEAAINGTISTNMGFFPDSVSTSTFPTAIGWGDVCSAPKGAMATCSVLIGLKLSLLVVSLVINESCEPYQKGCFPGLIVLWH